MPAYQDLPTFTSAGVVNAVIETPMDRTDKWEVDPATGLIRFSRALPKAMPGDYGFIPGTKAKDGDALDILVYANVYSWPLAVIQTRVLGILKMRDQGIEDHKIIGVPARDERYATWDGVAYRYDLQAFFAEYKRGVVVLGWGDAEEALQHVQETMR